MKYTDYTGLEPATLDSAPETAAAEFNLDHFLSDGETPELNPQSCNCQEKTACSCGKGKSKEYIYVFGDVVPILPSLNVEKEFYDLVDAEDQNRPFREIAYKYLRKTENLYLARELDWVFQIRGFINKYFIRIDDNKVTGLLIDAISPRPAGDIDYDILIATKTAEERHDSDSQSDLSVVESTKLYNISFQSYTTHLKEAIEQEIREQFPNENVSLSIVQGLFQNILQLAGNSGDQDKFRALNFLVLRYTALYVLAYKLANIGEEIGSGDNQRTELFELTRVSAGAVEVYGRKKIIEIIFSFDGQSTSHVQQYACTLDVSDEFPYVIIPLARYYPGL